MPRRWRLSTEHSRTRDTDTVEIGTWDFVSWIRMGEDPFEPHLRANPSKSMDMNRFDPQQKINPPTQAVGN